MKRLVSMSLCILMVLSMLVGCSSSSGTSGTAKKENVFTWISRADINSWNIFMQTDTISAIFNTMIYDGLVGGNRQGTYTPKLATEWKISDDGKTVTFKLQQGVKFHNGDPFTSADVKFTFEKFAKDKTVRSYNDWTSIDSVETPDPYTAVFHFTKPKADIMAALLGTPVVDKKAYDAEGDKLWSHPIGTGAWKFVEWKAGQQTVFTRNDDYFGWGNNKSNVDKIIFKPVLEDTTRVAAVQTGEADAIESMNMDQLKQLQSVTGLKTELYNTAASAILNFKITNSIFADKNLRLAVDYAIDRKQLVDTIAGGGLPSSWMVNEGSLGYKKVDPKFDLELAKQYLAKSSYKGEPFKILAVTGQIPRTNEILGALSSMLNKVGINSSVEFMESAALVASRTKGKYDCYVVAGAGSAGDPGSLITGRWMNDVFKSGYVNQKMFDLIKASNTEMNAQKRNDLIQQVLEIAYEDAAPSIPIFYMPGTAAFKDTVSGIKYYPDGVTDYSRVMKKQ